MDETGDPRLDEENSRAALKAAKAQLAYWKNEYEDAHRAKDPVRTARCERSIAQTELVISALTEAAHRHS
jgi:hypothetical protein